MLTSVPKRLLAVSVLGAAWWLWAPGTCAAQSLAEAARKERQRREAVEKSGDSAPTLTAQDLETAEGRLANEPGERAQNGDSSPKASERPTDSRSVEARAEAERSDGDDPESAASAETAEQHWRRRGREARDRVARAEDRVARLQQAIHLGQGVQYDDGGRQVMLSQRELKRRADAAEQELAAAREALEKLRSEARREGALPGWLR